ncbi:MAG TPA: flagellar filament capping protein FliD [Holophaga sp.]|nr:flagellar filament capping protein FliD [Holophaga sp.]
MTTVSFQGVSSGLQTDALVSAIIAQDSAGMERLQARETTNTNRRSALSTLSSDLSALTLSMAKVYDGINARTVSSTDADNTYVTAAATGASDGSYAVSVSSVATKGQLSPTTSGTGSSLTATNLAVSDPNAAILTSSAGTFAVQGTDGVVKTFTLATNSLYGLRDAINASGAGVTATVVNSGSGDNPYQLVVTANETGTGKTSGVVSLAAIANESDGSATTVVDSLGISSGTITGTYSSPTALTGGLSSTSGHGMATDAVFTVNGVQLTRTSNTVKDAVDGVTFTIKKASTDNSTTLTVAQDTATATSAMQDLITKYNALMTYYKQQTAVTKDSSGNITSGVLANDSTARSVINQVRSALNGTATGISSSAAYKTIGSIGITTGTSGTLTLDTTKFKEALENDATGVKNLFAFSGTTTNGTVTFKSASSATATGSMDFNLTYGTGGAVTGSLTYGGTTYDVTGSNGTVTGASGTPLEGLVLTVTGSGSGTMNLSRGVGQQLQDLVLSVTSVDGTIEKTRDLLEQQNKDLATRIDSLQTLLDKEETRLKKQFDEMESIISELKSNSGALSAITSS